MQLQDFTPPQNLEAEQAVLAAIINRPTDSIPLVSSALSSDAFYVPAHAKIYQTAVELFNVGKPVDAVTISTKLQEMGHLESVGGAPAIYDLLLYPVFFTNLEHHVQLVREAYYLRQLIAFGEETIRQARAKNQPIHEVVNEIDGKLTRISNDIYDGVGSQTEMLGTLALKAVEKSLANWEIRQSGGNPLMGYPTKFYDFDAMTGGFIPGDLVIIAGRPSMGKTSWAIQSAIQCARANKVSGLIFSLEMSAESLTYRIMSLESKQSSKDYGITASDLKIGRLTAEQVPALSTIALRLDEAKIGIDASPTITPQQILHTAQQFQRKNPNNKLGFIVIDYLQLMAEGKNNLVQELGAITRALKQIAMKLDVAVILLSQLSRNPEARNNKRPLMSDLRDSGAVEQDADLIVGLYRDDYYNPESTERGITELVILKQRNGPIGTVKLLFEPRLTKFENIDKSSMGY